MQAPPPVPPRPRQLSGMAATATATATIPKMMGVSGSGSGSGSGSTSSMLAGNMGKLEQENRRLADENKELRRRLAQMEKEKQQWLKSSASTLAAPSSSSAYSRSLPLGVLSFSSLHEQLQHSVVPCSDGSVPRLSIGDDSQQQNTTAEHLNSGHDCTSSAKTQPANQHTLAHKKQAALDSAVHTNTPPRRHSNPNMIKGAVNAVSYTHLTLPTIYSV